MLKRAVCILLCLSALLCISACDRGPKYSHAELAISLPDRFEVMENKDFDAAFSDGTAAVAILRIAFAAAVVEGIPETMDASEFGRFWLTKCNRYATVKSSGGIDFCEYTETVSSVEYYYLAAFYRSMNAYFVVLFGTDSKNQSALREEFISYAGSVYFTDN